MAESALIVRLRKTIAKTKDPLKKARLTAQLNKLTKKKEVGTAKSGDVQTARTHYSDFLPDKKLPKSVLEKFAGTLSDYGGKKSDYTAISKEAAGDVDPSRFNYFDPFGNYQNVTIKHGGSTKKAIKKAKKRKRAALRGYRAELRGG
mgnify:FL=1|tara:strand:+ start:364 stop:804 length:441 start_codon:yes stop_codon:yes gene_type:complete